MSIKPSFTPADVQRLMQQKREALERMVHAGLQRVGENFVTNARNRTATVANYRDRTGNLRASIGYVILKDGKQLMSGFPGSTGEGVSKGRQKAKQVAAGYPKGYVLIGVAGMEYAGAVEARKYDVINASVLIAGKDLNKIMEQITKTLK